MKNKKLVLDAGHYLETPGKRTPDGVREWTLNNTVCKYIAEYLKDYKVEIHRVDDATGKKDVTLAQRVKKTNKINPDAFVSIHHNGLKGKWGNHTGTEVYSHTNGSKEDKKLAKLLAPKIAKETGLKNRGAKAKELGVLTCNANIPAVLCEGGFMDSTIDNPVITSEKGQRAYAKAVADGVIEYLQLEKKETVNITTIETKKIKLVNDCSIYDISTEKAIKSYTAGTIIDNIIAVAEYKDNKYYMTEYSFSNESYSGFNLNDCEDYVEPIDEPKEEPIIVEKKHWLIRLIEFIIDLFK